MNNHPMLQSRLCWHLDGHAEVSNQPALGAGLRDDEGITCMVVFRDFTNGLVGLEHLKPDGSRSTSAVTFDRFFELWDAIAQRGCASAPG
jgi:hypothetical protein